MFVLSGVTADVLLPLPTMAVVVVGAAVVTEGSDATATDTTPGQGRDQGHTVLVSIKQWWFVCNFLYIEISLQIFSV